MLPVAAKAAIRRHLGIPAAGQSARSSPSGLRSIVRFEQLEQYFNALDVPTEAILLGEPYATVAVSDPPRAGDTVTVAVTIAGNSVSATYAVIANDTAFVVASKLASQLRRQLPAMEIRALQPIVYGEATLSLRSPQRVFLVSVDVVNEVASPSTAVAIRMNGDVYPAPEYVVDDGTTLPEPLVIHGLLPVCDVLEAQLLAASENLAFAQVGSRTVGGAQFVRAEITLRNSLLAQYRRGMGAALGLAL